MRIRTSNNQEVGVSRMREASELRRARVVLLCRDPKAPRIVAAHHVLSELADTTLAGGEAAAAAIPRLDADVVVADEWLGTRDGRTLLAWACQTGAAAVGILLASSQA